MVILVAALLLTRISVILIAYMVEAVLIISQRFRPLCVPPRLKDPVVYLLGVHPGQMRALRMVSGAESDGIMVISAVVEINV